MKEYVDEYRFRDRFLQSSNYKNNFSYEGLTALFEYIEELEDDIGIPDTKRFITGEF